MLTENPYGGEAMLVSVVEDADGGNYGCYNAARKSRDRRKSRIMEHKPPLFIAQRREGSEHPLLRFYLAADDNADQDHRYQGQNA